MNLSPIWIGLRYTQSKKQQRFLSLLSWLSLLGMILGVCSLIVVMAVMKGFQAEMQSRFLNLTPVFGIEAAHSSHANTFELSLADQVATKQSILATFPESNSLSLTMAYRSDALIGHFDQQRVITLLGLEASSLSLLNSLLVQGKANELLINNSGFGLYLGAHLANRLALDLGDKVVVSLPQYVVTPFGLNLRKKRFTVLGIFSTDSELDANTAFIDLRKAHRLFGAKPTTFTDVLVFDESHQLNEALSKNFVALHRTLTSTLHTQGLQLYSWQDKQQALSKAIKMEQFMMSFMLSLVIAVAAFNLIALLSIMVANKRSDIAVLQMMGLRRHQVLLVFLTQGLSLSVVSVLIGAVLGVLIATNITALVSWFENVLGVYLFDPSVFYITGLPAKLEASDVWYAVIFTLSLGLVFSLYPAFKASQIQASDALNYK